MVNHCFNGLGSLDHASLRDRPGCTPRARPGPPDVHAPTADRRVTARLQEMAPGQPENGTHEALRLCFRRIQVADSFYFTLSIFYFCSCVVVARAARRMSTDDGVNVLCLQKGVNDLEANVGNRLTEHLTEHSEKHATSNPKKHPSVCHASVGALGYQGILVP